jgi:hypothetical protein
MRNRKGNKKMENKKELLAYCGFYCGDCLGYTGLLAKRAKSLMTVLEKYRFEQIARSLFPKELKEYDRFHQMLGFMTGLKCPKICRERKEVETSCQVKKCCIDKGFYACYECDDLETCDKLKSLFEGLHYDASVKNLKGIKEMGLEAWIEKGKRHHYWDEIDD